MPHPGVRTAETEEQQQQQQQQEPQQQQQEEAAEALPDLAIAIVPCCVFSELFPERRVPLAAAEAAAVSPTAAAGAAAAVAVAVAASAAAAGAASPAAAAAACRSPLSPPAAEPWDLLQQEDVEALLGRLCLEGPFQKGPPGEGPPFMAEAEADGEVLVRTYEELLLWLHLQDPQRRLQQETLPIVGKNQVIFLPP